MKQNSWIQVRWFCIGAIAAFLCTPFLLPQEPAERNAQEDFRDIVTVTTKREVEIGLMYNGDYIYFFGSVPDPSADVIVKLTSTEDVPLSVNRKGKVALMWMNVKQFTVTGLPLLYKIHSTKPIHEILSADLAAELGIGYDVLKDRMQLKMVRGQAEPDDRDIVFDGVLRLKQEANLYNIDEKRIEITGGKLFKHYFRFPSAAKEGTYSAESYIFKDGKLIGKGIDEVVIQKKGLEATFTNLAHKHSVFYGIMAVVVALGMGLLVGFIFKKGGGH
jgi:uncharacterized protein (TIGR02186 family)